MTVGKTVKTGSYVFPKKMSILIDFDPLSLNICIGSRVFDKVGPSAIGRKKIEMS